MYLGRSTALNPLPRAIHAFKDSGHRGLATSLAALVARAGPFACGVVLVPVPSHARRLRRRGHDHTLRLARALGRLCGLPVLTNALVRHRATPPQVGLDAAARRRNLAGAFRVGSAAPVDGRHLLLVDDVLTTGATADACARTLLAAGARRVDVAVVARTPLATPGDGGPVGLSTA